MQISTASTLSVSADVLAVPSAAAAPADLPAGLPEPLDAALGEAVAEDEFKGSAGATIALRTLGHLPARWLLLVGVGDGGARDLRVAAGAAASFAREKGLASLALALPAADAAAQEALVEGVVAGNYRFDRNRAPKSRKAALEALTLVGVDLSDEARARGGARAAGQSLARDLVNAPAADIYPETLAEAARALASSQLKVEVWDDVRLKEAGMGGVEAVGRASTRRPRFVHMTWTPRGEPRARIALVGKGVTYDSGGLSLKPSSGQQTMRCDMGGAGAVIGAMSALDALQPDVEVHGIFAAAENMVAGDSYKLGDVLTMYSGKTVEIHNTDAEGRLLLADCLHYASELGVDYCVDLATLTGAAVVALGERYSAVYTKSDALAGRLQAAADASGEGFWRMPLDDGYKSMLKTEWASLKNVGGREAGSITAALFLSEFVDGPEWAHIDIAGPAFLSSSIDHLTTGGTGHPVMSLLRWLESF
jgi:leucyl aminopeptidase